MMNGYPPPPSSLYNPLREKFTSRTLGKTHCIMSDPRPMVYRALRRDTLNLISPLITGLYRVGCSHDYIHALYVLRWYFSQPMEDRTGHKHNAYMQGLERVVYHLRCRTDHAPEIVIRFVRGFLMAHWGRYYTRNGSDGIPRVGFIARGKTRVVRSR